MYERVSPSSYTVKKISDFPVPSWDVTKQTLPGRECFKGEFGYSDIPAGDRKIANLFYSVYDEGDVSMAFYQ
jgi:hypothetical protein